MPLDAELDYDVDEKVQKAFDVAARQLAAARILLDQEYELLKGEFGARGMNAGDGTWVPGIHIAQIVKRLLGPEFREQYPVRFHAQARFEQLLRRDSRNALIILGIKEAHVIRMPVEHQLFGVL